MIVVCTFVCLAIAADCHLPVLDSGPNFRGAVPFIFTQGYVDDKGVSSVFRLDINGVGICAVHLEILLFLSYITGLDELNADICNILFFSPSSLCLVEYQNLCHFILLAHAVSLMSISISC